MKLFLALTLLSGSFVYGMEEDPKKNPNISKSKKVNLYYDFVSNEGFGNVECYESALEENFLGNPLDDRKGLTSSRNIFSPQCYSSPNTINSTNTINTIIGYHLNKK